MVFMHAFMHVTKSWREDQSPHTDYFLYFKRTRTHEAGWEKTCHQMF
ncbi:hypothetical protein HMPREF3192_00403 [Atopobium deltae]|uniref:Uncharacterized protein n=1 Tax=Atopobium deltae TaxID=1393034 RepID=A0A133XWL3_9ACTN|nr:hypothetical protein HMPREF3192_00403 [Atopobium deltae]